jgi:hypothetical protein
MGGLTHFTPPVLPLGWAHDGQRVTHRVP